MPTYIYVFPLQRWDTYCISNAGETATGCQKKESARAVRRAGRQWQEEDCCTREACHLSMPWWWELKYNWLQNKNSFITLSAVVKMDDCIMRLMNRLLRLSSHDQQRCYQSLQYLGLVWWVLLLVELLWTCDLAQSCVEVCRFRWQPELSPWSWHLGTWASATGLWDDRNSSQLSLVVFCVSCWMFFLLELTQWCMVSAVESYRGRLNHLSEQVGNRCD